MMVMFMSCARDFQTSHHTSFAQALVGISMRRNTIKLLLLFELSKIFHFFVSEG